MLNIGKIIFILFTSLVLVACNGESSLNTFKNGKITSIKKDFCIEERCNYTIRIKKELYNRNFYIGNNIESQVSEGDVISFKYDNDRIIKELILLD